MTLENVGPEEARELLPGMRMAREVAFASAQRSRLASITEAIHELEGIAAEGQPVPPPLPSLERACADCGSAGPVHYADCPKADDPPKPGLPGPRGETVLRVPLPRKESLPDGAVAILLGKPPLIVHYPESGESYVVELVDHPRIGQP